MTAFYSDFNAGDDMAGDGSQGNPWKTLQKAIDDGVTGSSPGDGAGHTIWLRNHAPFVEDVTVTEDAAALANNPLVIEGYTDTPGDGGVATLDGETTSNYGMRTFAPAGGDANNYYWVLKGIRFTRYAIAGFDAFGPSSGFMQDVIFRKCRFDNCGIGATIAQGHKFLDCWFHDNSGHGIQGHSFGVFTSVLRSIFEDNGIGFSTRSLGGAIWNCLFRGNTVSAIDFQARAMPVISCIIDGVDKAGAIGVDYSNMSDGVVKIFNSIIMDCVVGVNGPVAGNEELSAIYNSLFYLNSADFANGAAARLNCLFVDPDFVDRDNKDYGINEDSPCKEAGLDLKFYDHYDSTAGRVDIGLMQQAVSATGTGNIGAPLGFSVER